MFWNNDCKRATDSVFMIVNKNYPAVICHMIENSYIFPVGARGLCLNPDKSQDIEN